MPERSALPIRPKHGGNLAWAAQFANCSPSSILDFSASINPLGPPQSAIAAIQDQLPQLRAYPNPDYGDLRQALSKIHKVDPAWVVPGNGAAELLTWIGRDLARLPSVALVTPAFGDYERALVAFGASITHHTLAMEHLESQPFSHLDNVPHANSIDIHAVVPSLAPALSSSSIKSHQNRGILINSPHNPTGVLFSAESLEQCCRQFGQVVVDEAFMDFLPPEHQQSLVGCIATYPNLVIVRSLTKFYSLPGLRIGYAIAHPDHIQRWQQWRDPWPVNTLAAAAAIAIVQDRKFQKRTWQWLTTARSRLFKELSSIPGLTPLPGTANFLLVRSEQSVVALQQWLLQHHRILIRDCMSFVELGDRYFRIAIRTDDDNSRLLNALTEGMGQDLGG